MVQSTSFTIQPSGLAHCGSGREKKGVLDGFPGVGVVKWMNGIRAQSVMRGLLLSVSCPARMDRITLTPTFQWLFCIVYNNLLPRHDKNGLADLFPNS